MKIPFPLILTVVLTAVLLLIPETKDRLNRSRLGLLAAMVVDWINPTETEEE